MILPIRNAMKEPEHFWPLFVWMFIGIAAIFTIFALVGYAAYGSAVETTVLLNLPHNDPVAVAVKVGYMIALVLSLPLMFLPAARITELWAFGVTEKGTHKWRKNGLRTVEVLMCGLLAFF